MHARFAGIGGSHVHSMPWRLSHADSLRHAVNRIVARRSVDGGDWWLGRQAEYPSSVGDVGSHLHHERLDTLERDHPTQPLHELDRDVVSVQI